MAENWISYLKQKIFGMGIGQLLPSRMTYKIRRVEITGPVGRKMVINALNSGAKTFMACFEDATSPTWANMIEGQAQYERCCTENDLV